MKIEEYLRGFRKIYLMKQLHRLDVFYMAVTKDNVMSLLGLLCKVSPR